METSKSSSSTASFRSQPIARRITNDNAQITRDSILATKHLPEAKPCVRVRIRCKPQVLCKESITVARRPTSTKTRIIRIYLKDRLSLNKQSITEATLKVLQSETRTWITAGARTWTLWWLQIWGPRRTIRMRGQVSKQNTPKSLKTIRISGKCKSGH